MRRSKSICLSELTEDQQRMALILANVNGWENAKVFIAEMKRLNALAPAGERGETVSSTDSPRSDDPAGAGMEVA